MIKNKSRNLLTAPTVAWALRKNKVNLKHVVFKDELSENYYTIQVNFQEYGPRKTFLERPDAILIIRSIRTALEKHDIKFTESMKDYDSRQIGVYGHYQIKIRKAQ